MVGKCIGHDGLEALLLAALQAAPRRYRMPTLPADADAAAARGTETALAFAIEAARVGKQRHQPAAAGLQDLFTQSLARLIREAMAPAAGDAAFQALVLRTHDAEVGEYVRLSEQWAADRRAVRSAVDAIAHPGKLRATPAGSARDALGGLHGLAAAGSWTALSEAVEDLLIGQEFAGHAAWRASLEALLASAALQRLARGSALLRREAVRHYRALCEQHGPQAGSDSAAAQGRASARTGEAAEQAAANALGEVARLLNRRPGSTGPYQLVRGLRTPRGYPGEAGKAKEEWDAAILRRADAAGPADIVLLAEVKASAAATTSDFSRLYRGLHRLAHASAHENYAFACAHGEVLVAGESLRRLQPHGHVLPQQVIYCCSAPAETTPRPLSAASKAVLLAEPPSIGFAHQLALGAAPPASQLVPVWDALTAAPRLRSVLHQYDTACAAREAMLHPDDLLQAVEHGLAKAEKPEGA